MALFNGRLRRQLAARLSQDCDFVKANLNVLSPEGQAKAKAVLAQADKPGAFDVALLLQLIATLAPVILQIIQALRDKAA